MCVGVEFLALDVLLHTKSEQKVIGNWFWAPMIFINPVKTEIYKKYICVGRIWIVTGYFLFEKQALIILSKVTKYVKFYTERHIIF